MRIIILCAFWSLCGIVILFECGCQAAPPPVPSPPDFQRLYNSLPGQNVSDQDLQAREDWRWTVEPFVLPDADYTAIRTKFDAIPDNDKRVTLRNAWLQDADTHKENALDLFRWAYADVNSRDRTLPRGERESADKRILRALWTIRPPYSYDVARLRFITESRLWNNAPPELVRFSDRLLKFVPKDELVQSSTIKILSEGYILRGEPALKAHMISVSGAMTSANLDPLVDHEMAARVYWTLWNVDGHPQAYRSRAVEECNKFLDLAPATDYSRPAAEYMLAKLKSSGK